MLRLIPMKESEFETYSQNAATEYAKEKMASGNWHPDEAQKRAEQEFNSLLPNGIKTENQFLYLLKDGIKGDTVGMIWFMLDAKRPIPVAFIFDFNIYETFRRYGYGLQGLQAAELQASELGAKRMELHVFAHNKVAIALYEKAGYHVTNLNLAKEIG
jgi:ribosomal protein S18 acetylase RimI-like enzyme